MAFLTPSWDVLRTKNHRENKYNDRKQLSWPLDDALSPSLGCCATMQPPSRVLFNRTTLSSIDEDLALVCGLPKEKVGLKNVACLKTV